MTYLLGDFKSKVREENILKPIVSNVILYDITYENFFLLEQFAASKNATVTNTMSAHRNIHKHTWSSPDGWYSMLRILNIYSCLAINKYRTKS